MEIRLSVAVDPDDPDDSGAESGDEEEILEVDARVELLEGQGALWRCFLLDTPELLKQRVPHLMLLRGRELVVPVPAGAGGVAAAMGGTRTHAHVLSTSSMLVANSLPSQYGGYLSVFGSSGRGW